MTDTTVIPEELRTEQEKDTASATKGVGPASASEGSPGPVETMEDLGIGPREPYPEGNPPPPSADDLANIERAKQAPNIKKEPVAPAKLPVHPNTDAFGNPIPPKGGA
jgi:hypothetical protein